MHSDRTNMADQGVVGAGVGRHEPVQWRCHWTIDQFDAGAEDVRAGRYVSSTNPAARLGQPVVPTQTLERAGNVLTYGGADILWLGIKGGLSATTGLANTYFNNANAAIIVGSSGAAAAASDTDLSASTDANREAVGMEASYPLHTTGNGTTAALNIAFRSVFTTAMANFAWEEWGITNTTKSSAPLAGRLLNRKVEALGTKTSAATWTITATLSLS